MHFGALRFLARFGGFCFRGIFVFSVGVFFSGLSWFGLKVRGVLCYVVSIGSSLSFAGIP